MKKTILFLLFTVISYGQTLQNPIFGVVTEKNNASDSTPAFFVTQQADGVHKKTPAALIAKVSTVNDSLSLKANKNITLQEVAENGNTFEKENSLVSLLNPNDTGGLEVNFGITEENLSTKFTQSSEQFLLEAQSLDGQNSSAFNITKDNVSLTLVRDGVPSTISLEGIENKQPLENQRLSTTNDVIFNSVTATNSATINSLGVGANPVHQDGDGDIVVRNKFTGAYGKSSQNTLNNLVIPGDRTTGSSILLFQGDSMTAGVPPASPYPNSIVTSNVFDKVNNAVGSKTIATIRAEAPTLDDVLYRFNARENIYVIWAGTNDLYVSHNVSEAFKNLEATCRERQKKGWKVVVLTTVPRCGFASDGTTTMASLIFDYNTMIRQRWSTFADNIADVASDSIISSTNPCLDTTYYNGDGIHFTNLGNSLLLPYIEKAINELATQITFQDVEIRGKVVEPVTIKSFLGTSRFALNLKNESNLAGNLTAINFNSWNNGYGDSDVARIEAVSNGASAGQSVFKIKVAQHGGTGATDAIVIDGTTRKSLFTGAIQLEKGFGTTETALKIYNTDAVAGAVQRIEFIGSDAGYGANGSTGAVEVISNGASAGQSVMNFKVAEHHGWGALTVLSLDGVSKKSTFVGGIDAYSLKTTGLTTSEINAIASPAEGLIVYNITLHTYCFYDGTNWKKITHSNM